MVTCGRITLFCGNLIQMAKPDIAAMQTDRTGVARIFGLRELNTVNKWRARGMPRVTHGVYSIPDVVQWRIEEIQSKGALDVDDMPAIVEARTQLLRAQEQHKRLEIARLEGALLEADEVRQTVLTLCQHLVTALEGLPTRAAQQAASATTEAEVAHILREHCADARRDLARQIKTLAQDIPDRFASSDAAPAEDGGAMGGRGAEGATGEPAAGALVE